MKDKRLLSTDQLWHLVVLAGFAFFVSLVPLPPNDFWWHLKIGEIIYKTGSIPETNLFAWTLPPDAPFVYGAWLGELLFYLLYRIGRLELVNLARNVITVAAFWLLAVETRRMSKSWRLAMLAILLAAAMTINNLPIRPQLWSWLPFMIFTLILNRYADGELSPRRLMLLPLIMVFWVNAHGAFILGGVMIGIFTFGEGLQKLLRLENARSWREIAWLGGAGIAAGLAMLINPRFTAVINYVLDLLTDQPSQRLIEEWQSPAPGGIANTTFYLSILLWIAVLVFTRYRLKMTEILLIASFLWLAWSGQRYVLWYGLVSIPILMKALHALPIRTPRLIPHRSPVNVLIAVILFIPALLVQPWFVERFPLPERYWKMVHRNAPEGPLIGVETPLDAVSYLRQHPGGRLFNEMGYGSYLIWALPEEGVFIDPRVELYPYEQWQDYVRITRGARYNEILAQYGVDRILLDVELQSELLTALENDPAWKKVFSGGRAQVWEKQP